MENINKEKNADGCAYMYFLVLNAFNLIVCIVNRPLAIPETLGLILDVHIYITLVPDLKRNGDGNMGKIFLKSEISSLLLFLLSIKSIRFHKSVIQNK